MSPVRGGTVFGAGDEAAPAVAADVAGHPLMGAEDLHRGRRRPHLDLLVDQAVGHRVVVEVELDVVVDVDPGLLPGRELVASLGQRPQGRAFQVPEEVATGDLKAAERSPVHLRHLLGDVCVQLCEREVAPLPQRRQHPALDDLDPDLHRRLVARGLGRVGSTTVP